MDFEDEWMYEAWGLSTGRISTLNDSDAKGHSAEFQQRLELKESELKLKEKELKRQERIMTEKIQKVERKAALVEKKNKKLEQTINSTHAIKWGRLSTEECPVCAEEWNDDSEVRIMPCCKNILHMECFDEIDSKHCPFCRAERIGTTPFGEDESTEPLVIRADELGDTLVVRADESTEPLVISRLEWIRIVQNNST